MSINSDKWIRHMAETSWGNLHPILVNDQAKKLRLEMQRLLESLTIFKECYEAEMQF